MVWQEVRYGEHAQRRKEEDAVNDRETRENDVRRSSRLVSREHEEARQIARDACHRNEAL